MTAACCTTGKLVLLVFGANRAWGWVPGKMRREMVESKESQTMIGRCVAYLKFNARDLPLAETVLNPVEVFSQC